MCADCFNCVAPNTQAAFVLAATAPLGHFLYDEALAALIRLATDKGNVVPLDGAQIAGLKLHGPDAGGPPSVRRDTRAALIAALLHMHNTEESHADLRAKAADLADQVATADAAIVDAKRQLQQLEHDADLLKRSHTTLTKVIDTNQLRPFGLLPRQPVVPAKVKPLRVHASEAGAAPAYVAAPPPLVHDAREVYGAAAAAEPAADDDSEDAEDDSDSDDDGAEPPTAAAAAFDDVDFSNLTSD